MRNILRVVKIIMAISIAMTATTPALSAQMETGKFPDVLSVSVHARGGNRFDFDATISSPYDTPQRYADAFRAMGKDGVVYGVRILVHDHADEQPFTRDLYNVLVKPGVKALLIQARDQKYGYGGKTVTVLLPGR